MIEFSAVAVVCARFADRVQFKGHVARDGLALVLDQRL